MTINPKQEHAIQYLLQGKTEAQIARQVRVSRTTVSYWRNHVPEFRAELTARRNQLWEQHRDELAGIYRQAIDILKDALNSPQENVRIRAALGIAKFPPGWGSTTARCAVGAISVAYARLPARVQIATNR